MARPGLLLYFDILPALDKLPHEAVGELLLAALHYAQDSIEPTFDDTSLDFAWAFLKPAIDRDGVAYQDKRQRGDWLVYCRQCKRDGEQPLDFETWRERTDNDTLRHVDTALPKTAQNQPSTPPAPAQSENQHHSDSAAQPLAPARDSRGVVFLDDGEYSALVADLGEQEVKRCIDYLSEYCITHNKRYHDWGLMIRRANREGWGLPPSKLPSGAAKEPLDYQPSAERIQRNNDWLDVFLAEQAEREGKNG